MSSSQPPFELFVPGRLCLFGEHSDWAGSHRGPSTSDDVSPGCCLVVPTMNLGLHARVALLETPVLRMTMTTEQGAQQIIDLSLRLDDLLREAKRGGFWFYVAGTAYQVALSHKVGGLHIDNYKTTLPLKKGLSSSAAVCVLVARAFNLAYDLKLTMRGEMELAYLGETTGPSLCGRMDQVLAFSSPTLTHFDGAHMVVRPLTVRVGSTFYFVVVDLRAAKNTLRILSGLQAAYPTPRDETDRGLHHLLGPLNLATTARALECLEADDAPALGALMCEAQANFDRLAGPLVPDQLGVSGSPVLHALLADEGVRSLTLGGKGVGSQGDGSALLLCASQEAADRLCAVLGARGMHAVPVVLRG